MAFCYDIELEITRSREGEEPYTTTLPGSVRVYRELSPDEIKQEARGFWFNFAAMLGDTAPDRANEYTWNDKYTVAAIYEC